MGSVRKRRRVHQATGWPSATRSSAIFVADHDRGGAIGGRAGFVDLIGSQSIWDDITFSSVISGWCRCANGFFAPLSRS